MHLTFSAKASAVAQAMVFLISDEELCPSGNYKSQDSIRMGSGQLNQHPTATYNIYKSKCTYPGGAYVNSGELKNKLVLTVNG